MCNSPMRLAACCLVAAPAAGSVPLCRGPLPVPSAAAATTTATVVDVLAIEVRGVGRGLRLAAPGGVSLGS